MSNSQQPSPSTSTSSHQPQFNGEGEPHGSGSAPRCVIGGELTAETLKLGVRILACCSAHEKEWWVSEEGHRAALIIGEGPHTGRRQSRLQVALQDFLKMRSGGRQ